MKSIRGVRGPKGERADVRQLGIAGGSGQTRCLDARGSFRGGRRLGLASGPRPRPSPTGAFRQSRTARSTNRQLSVPVAALAAASGASRRAAAISAARSSFQTRRRGARPPTRSSAPPQGRRLRSGLGLLRFPPSPSPPASGDAGGIVGGASAAGAGSKARLRFEPLRQSDQGAAERRSR